MREVARFPLEDGGIASVEVDEDEFGARPVSRSRGGYVEASGTLDRAMAQIQQVANTMVRPLSHISPRPDGVEVAFGVRLNVEAGAVIASNPAEAHFQITLTWQASGPDPSAASHA
ncbi:CU044_2847 family protein [Streptomyces sp. NPDC059063]|uniref:CU044_2847 family protein n=1 Tax=unclassified Streptomyces TaxID=2593676 RepID=UPI0036B7021C